MELTDELRRSYITCGLDLLGPKYGGAPAKQFMAAIAYQESNFEHRHQIGGPAHGFWQFEMNGGVVGVMKHHASNAEAVRVCKHYKVLFERKDIYDALEHNDELAACFARLLLWTDPKAIPTDIESAWEYYIRAWRPGKPHIRRWPFAWKKAKELWGNA